jgi:hypothetical protein
MKQQVGDNKGTCTWHEIMGQGGGKMELDATAATTTQYYTHSAFDKETFQSRDKISNTPTDYHLLFLPRGQ